MVLKCANAGIACEGKEPCRPLLQGKIPDCPYFEPCDFAICLEEVDSNG